jgi:hypothetical protein
LPDDRRMNRSLRRCLHRCMSPYMSRCMSPAAAPGLDRVAQAWTAARRAGLIALEHALFRVVDVLAHADFRLQFVAPPDRLQHPGVFRLYLFATLVAPLLR